MSGTEASFVRKLNKRPVLAPVYSCGMGAQFVSGIPDRYYEGTRRPLWVEFKHIKKNTHRFDAIGAISDLQRAWLIRCSANGNHPHVIVGVGLSEGFILDDPVDWNITWRPQAYAGILQSIDDIAQYIERYCNGTR